MNRKGLALDLEICNEELEKSFAVQDGAFLRGSLEISEKGVSRSDRTFAYEGLVPSELELVKVIGRGASSQVELFYHKRTETLMALKMINIFEQAKRQQIMEEVRALYDAKCPTLVGFYGAFFNGSSISIALEYMDQGCLKTLIDRYGPIPEPVLAGITFQVLWGLGYLRHEKRVHRDIKPQNILCNSKGEVKLTDFGISKELENSIGLCQTFVGTFQYMSPERIQSHPYSYASDIWSLGLVLLECITGKYPYPACHTYIDMVQTILESGPNLPPSGRFSTEFESFIGYCIKRNHKDRLPAEILLRAPWFQKWGVHDLGDAQAIVYNWLATTEQKSE